MGIERKGRTNNSSWSLQSDTEKQEKKKKKKGCTRFLFLPSLSHGRKKMDATDHPLLSFFLISQAMMILKKRYQYEQLVDFATSSTLSPSGEITSAIGIERVDRGTPPLILC